jgi:hypothetical protein
MKLGDLLVTLRPDWDAESWHRMAVDKALLQLAADPRSPFELCEQAVHNARNAANRTPECVLRPLDSEATVRTITPTPPRHDDPACPEHGGTIRDDNGTFACCKYDHDPKPPAYLRCGTSAGPSDEARELIETRLGPHRRAREMSQEGEQR